MKYTATPVPTSSTYNVTELQTCINSLLEKINAVYAAAYIPPAEPTTPGTTPTTTLPLATSTSPGVVKVGANILLSEDGTISVQSPLAYGANAVQATGIIIPLYQYPANVFTNVVYNAVIDACKTYKRVPTMIIINPSNGAGDPSVGTDGNYRVAIDRLHGAGCKVVGYVSSSYTARPLATVEHDVSVWKQLYPAVDGIFVDEMTYANDPAAILYYQNLNAYIKSLGFRYTITNPGAPFAGQYQVANVADIIVGWETSYYPTLVQQKEDWDGGAVAYSLYKRGALVYGQPTLDTVAATSLAKYYGWIYISADGMPNPWDNVPSYLTSEFALLNSL